MAFASPLAPGQDLPPAPAPLVNAYHPSKPPGNPHTGPLGSLLPPPQGRKRLRLTLLPLDRGPQCHPTQGEDTGGSEESAGPSYPEGSGQRPPAQGTKPSGRSQQARVAS